MDAGRYVCRDTMGGWPGDWIIYTMDQCGPIKI